MCQLYLRFNSCCGVPVRIALIFIAILSIVTGAIINGALKKAGVDVSTIRDVYKIHLLKNLTHFEESNDTLLSSRESKDIDIYQDVEITTEVITRRTTTSKEPRFSTVEIIGEDGHTEIIRFRDDSEESSSLDSDESIEETETTTKPTVPTTPTTTTLAVGWGKNDTSLVSMVGQVNRNGLNFMAMIFIALGILLLVANFLNSPDLMLLYVVLCLANCIASLVLLTGVVVECTKAPNTCVLSKMDWFSGFMVTIFWFIYILLWAFFAAVANSFANDGGVSNLV